MNDENDAPPSSRVELYRALGLADEEYRSIVEILGREPTDLELALYGVMWSEHCSYKSSRRHLGRLPTEGPEVLVGPGENAGVLDVGDGLAVAVRIESHNHPSFVEPYEGAATGVGGILRDIFTMGARPIALMDSLFIGPENDSHSRFILDGIVRGIAGYGNSVGVPTVGGGLTFGDCYRGNPLVNVFCLGIVEKDELVLARASGVGNLAVLLGSSTGRDGIGGVSVLASAGFSSDGDLDAPAKRPAVQVGDPYEEKRLLEACLELVGAGLVVGVQDLGGGGIACATSETASRAGLGMDVDLDAVRRREPHMSPVEVATSESQERMLVIVAPDDLAAVEAVCGRFEVGSSVIGTVVDCDPDGVGRLRMRAAGEVLASVPAASLADEGPRYDRPLSPPPTREADPEHFSLALDANEVLLRFLADPAPVYSQYDHELFLNTLFRPGEADATLLRLGPPLRPFFGRGIALSVDANPGWCGVDPYLGTLATVAESALNVSCVGARPIGLVNCLNFGEPEDPVVMWQLSGSIDGMAEACRVLSIPVVGGNVSLYNASAGKAIDPTPVVAVVGRLDALCRRPPAIGWQEGDHLVLLGPRPSGLSGSRLAREFLGARGGELQAIDLVAHRRLCDLVRTIVAAEAGEMAPGLCSGVHDVSDGGLAVTLAESALAARCGFLVDSPGSCAALFSELPGAVVMATSRPDEFFGAAEKAGVPALEIGMAGGDRLVVEGLVDLSLDEVMATWRDRVANLLENVAGH